MGEMIKEPTTNLPWQATMKNIRFFGAANVKNDIKFAITRRIIQNALGAMALLPSPSSVPNRSMQS